MGDDPSPEDAYPRTWLLMDLLEEGPRLVGREVVDLSPAAIELRRTAEKLRSWADERERWLRTDQHARWPRLDRDHRRELSFGPEIAYWVERDASEQVHDGRPVRHLVVHNDPDSLTPATSAEIGQYFYGRRPAAFGRVARDRTHGLVGYEWNPLDREDARRLLVREMDDGEPDGGRRGPDPGTAG